ncbi:arylsulfatase B-like [Stylophora pistillata]|uniref:Arylsulfatase B n=1 Tax=Stylophora pistillata TaxID=50429 RepID=A0A2B4SXX0_STYPI|nr:arylsulfatase B-like [Stylophora pistillata]PFX34029.1 Arylsulfatase B [Stylophora pistillata]
MKFSVNSFIFVTLTNLHIFVSSAASKPNILFVLVDDLGWSDVGFHGSKIQTPNVDKLANEGVILDSYYVQPICSPTRGALMSGRYPIHLGMQHGIVHTGCPFGLPLNITTLPQKLKEVGYSTHMIGKWHLGFYNWESTPTYRGFDTFYGFYNGAEDHYTHVISHFLDFRDNKEIVRDMNETYSVNAFTKRAEQIVKSHDAQNGPLFLYMAFQNVHSPVQAPKQHVDKYSFINDTIRRSYAGMVDIMDEAVGNITGAFKEAGLWDNTLMIFSTDNGGVPKNGGYDYPLRGPKDTLWEGGVRGVGFVHGKMLSRSGVKSTGLIHVTDWYPTLVNLAGGYLNDEDLPLDGHDVWKTISNGEASPRTEILHNIDTPSFPDTELGFAYQGIGLRVGDMKLLMGVPNISYFIPPEERNISEVNSVTDQDLNDPPVPTINVALFNVTADPYEKNDLSKKFPDKVKELQDRLEYYMKGLVPPANKPSDPKARRVARENGAWTPWM